MYLLLTKSKTFYFVLSFGIIMSLFFILVVSLFSGVTLTTDVKVLELTGEFFENYTTKSDGVTVIMFYTPWCPHCVEIKPELFKAATRMAKLNSKNIFGLINCEDPKNVDICQQQNIESYPTIKAFSPQNKVNVFNGAPTEDDFIKFIENPEAFSELHDVSSESGSDNENVPDNQLNHTRYLNVHNFNETLSKTRHALVFFYAPWCPHCQESKSGVDSASEKLKSKDHEIFAINCEDKSSKALCGEQGIEGYPTIKYFHNGELFAEYEDEYSMDAYLKYLSKPPKEKVKPSQREKVEEDIEEEEKMESVKYLTEDTFKTVVQHHNHHVMVMFYAPWCSHCQAAKPAYNFAAKTIRESNSNHVLAAVNCNDKANEKLCENEEITGFPTFVHYFGGKRVQIYADTPFNADNLIKYFNFPKKVEL